MRRGRGAEFRQGDSVGEGASAGVEHSPLARVARQCGGALELGARFIAPPESGEQVAPNARQQMVAVHQRIRPELIHDGQPRCRPIRHADSNSAVELDDGGRCELGELRVQRGDARPIRFIGRNCPRMARREGCLQCVRAGVAGEGLGSFERGQAQANQQPIPALAVLIKQQDRFT